MSREKDAEEGDRRGLVEEGTVCPPENTNKTSKSKVLTEIKWVAESVPETSTTTSATVVTTATVVATATENVNVKVLIL
jgi:receptor-type tyrosine-protein phosphatase R